MFLEKKNNFEKNSTSAQNGGILNDDQENRLLPQRDQSELEGLPSAASRISTKADFPKRTLANNRPQPSTGRKTSCTAYTLICPILMVFLCVVVPWMLACLNQGSVWILPGEDRLLHVLTTICESVQVSSSESSLTYYLLQQKPVMQDFHDFRVDGILTFNFNNPAVLVYFLNPGSKLNTTFDSPDGNYIEASVVRGAQNYELWKESGAGVSAQAINEKGSTKKTSLEYFIGFDEGVVFLIFSTFVLDDIGVRYSLDLKKTMYDLSNPQQICHSNCTFPLDFGSQQTVVIEFPMDIQKERGDAVAVHFKGIPRGKSYSIAIMVCSIVLSISWFFLEIKVRSHKSKTVPKMPPAYDTFTPY